MSVLRLKDKYPDFYLTQTSVKDLEKDETCPSRWKGLWLDKTVTFPSNEDMDKGKYFEWLSLGGGAITGEDVTDLPRVYGGKKSADQLRIEEQASRFKGLFDKESPEFMGFELVDSQLELRVGIKKGTIDFMTRELETGDLWLNDLKLTRDVTSTRSKYGWGHDWDQLDMLQMIHYRDLYYDTYGIMPRTALWVFDYSPQRGIKIGEIRISERAKMKKDIRFDSALDVILLYEERGWTTVPSESECKNCPLNCLDRFKAPPIEKIIVNI